MRMTPRGRRLTKPAGSFGFGCAALVCRGSAAYLRHEPLRCLLNTDAFALAVPAWRAGETGVAWKPAPAF